MAAPGRVRVPGSPGPREPRLLQGVRGLAVQGRLVLLWLCLRAAGAGFCELHLCCYFQEAEGGCALQRGRPGAAQAPKSPERLHEGLIVPQPPASPKLSVFLRSLALCPKSRRNLSLTGCGKHCAYSPKLIPVAQDHSFPLWQYFLLLLAW